MPVLQLFSQTKFVTCVAVMQQVEKGLLTLDDPEIVLKYCPELGELPICKGYDEHGQAILEKPENKITLRMLLDHTSGESFLSHHRDQVGRLAFTTVTTVTTVTPSCPLLILFEIPSDPRSRIRIHRTMVNSMA